MFGFNPWLIGGVAAVILAALTFGGCEHMNANNLRAENKVLLSSVDRVIEANKTNLTTIDMLVKSVGKWRALATPSARMEAAAARADELELENERLNKALAKRAELDYAKPDCLNILETDFEAVCPGIAAGLRERAGRYEDRPRGDPGAGGGEDRPLFD